MLHNSMRLQKLKNRKATVRLKGTVSAISSVLPVNGDHSQFTMVPFKPLTDLGRRTYPINPLKRF